MKALSLAASALAISLSALLASAGHGPSLSASEQHVVQMRGIAFEPRSVRAHVGDTIRWENQDIVDHTASARDRSFDVDAPAARSGTATMGAVGTYAYICRYHPNMTGEIVVEP